MLQVDRSQCALSHTEYNIFEDVRLYLVVHCVDSSILSSPLNLQHITALVVLLLQPCSLMGCSCRLVLGLLAGEELVASAGLLRMKTLGWYRNNTYWLYIIRNGHHTLPFSATCSFVFLIRRRSVFIIWHFRLMAVDVIPAVISILRK